MRIRENCSNFVIRTAFGHRRSRRFHLATYGAKLVWSLSLLANCESGKPVNSSVKAPFWKAFRRSPKPSSRQIKRGEQLLIVWLFPRCRIFATNSVLQALAWPAAPKPIDRPKRVCSGFGIMLIKFAKQISSRDGWNAFDSKGQDIKFNYNLIFLIRSLLPTCFSFLFTKRPGSSRFFF